MCLIMYPPQRCATGNFYPLDIPISRKKLDQFWLSVLYNVNKANKWWPLSFLILLSVFKIMIHGPNCEISFEPEGRLCCSHSPHLKISPGLHWSCWRQRQGSDPVDLGIGRSTRPLSVPFLFHTPVILIVKLARLTIDWDSAALSFFFAEWPGLQNFLCSLKKTVNLQGALNVNTAKGTTDPRVEFSLPKLKQVQTQIYKSWSNFIFSRISTKPQLQNLNQT